MALSTYSDLKSAVLDWMVRSDLSGSVADWVTLGEAKLNRELNPVEADNTLTGTVDSREIDTSALSVVEPIALYLVDTDTSDEIQLTKKDSFPHESTSGEPRYWRFIQHASTPKIVFDCPLDAAYAFRFTARLRFALSDAATTNWLLTNHPDLYLAATILEGCVYARVFDEIPVWKIKYDDALVGVRSIIADSKRGLLGVDNALSRVGRRDYYDGSL